MPGRSKNTHTNSSERTLFNVLPVDPDKDVRAGLYPGVACSTVQDLLQSCSAIGLSGSRIAGRLTGFDLPPDQRHAWPGGERLLGFRHQIVLRTAERLELDRHTEQVRTLASSIGAEPLLAEVLVTRGLTNPQVALDYLSPSLTSELQRLPRFEAMERAVNELYAAIQAHKRIVVVADYDADGNCAAAILRRCIELCGGSCEVIQPDRVRENYGLSAKLLPRVLALHPEVVVTLDLGTSDKQQFAELTTRGIYSICVDHHPPQADKLAEPAVLANPHLDPGLVGWHDLCASGLTWITALGIFERHFGAASTAAQQHAQLLSPFAAIGTVADVMQIKGLNRALVSTGSKEMLTSELEPFQALTTQLRNEQVTGEYLAFYVGPMLNACGRINLAAEDQPGTFPVAEFLNCRQLKQAEQLSEQLLRVNRQRQTMERHAVDITAREALAAQLSQGIPVHFGTVLQLPDVHEGIVGLVAARMTEFMQCPMIVLTRDLDGNWKGSGRSIPGVNLNEILESLKQKSLVLGGGGHPAAIGVVVAAHLVEQFSQAFRAECQARLATLPRWFKEYRPDLVMCVEDLTDPLHIATIHRVASALEPCGRANEPLKILLPNVRIASSQTSKAGHLRLTIEDGPNPARTWAHQERLDAVAFARSPAARFLSSSATSQVCDLIVQPTFDRSQQYQGSNAGFSVQILLAQRSAFDDSLPPTSHEANTSSSATPRRRKTTYQPKATPLFDATLSEQPPTLTCAQDFYGRFGITIIKDTVEFRPAQFEFVAKQILIDRTSPGENLLYRAKVAAGKTVIALLRSAEILARDPQTKILYLTPQIDLVKQALSSIRKFTTLADNEVVEFTGQIPHSQNFRDNLLSGEAKILVGTPQTFLPFAAQHLKRFGLVILDEVHLIRGDGTKEEASKYAYRAIARQVLDLQDKKHQIRLLAQSGSPADTSKKCIALAKTLRARYERLEEKRRRDAAPLNHEMKRWEIAELPLDPLTRSHLSHLRDIYIRTFNEIFKAVPLWVIKPDVLPTLTHLHSDVISAVLEFRKGCQPFDGKTLPQRTRFIEVEKRLLGALGALCTHYKKQKIAVSPQLFSAISRVAELGAIVRSFETLRSKGRSAFMRAVTRKMLEAIYPPRSDRPAAFSNCYVRLYRREGMQELLGWAMTEQTAHAIYSEFRRLYPGRYSSYSSGERPTYTKQTPRPWRDLLQFTEQARAQIGVPTEKATHKVPKRSRLDILDDRLLSELTLSERVDLKESALREILATLRPDEKVMVMVEEKFEARLLAERLKTLGMKAGWYAGRSVAKRHGMRENLKAFHSGQIQILCSTSAGDTGHDIPGVSRVIRWVPITSPKKNEQSHGRAGRQPGIPGVYTVLTIADDDPDFDERMRNKIAHSRLASMDRV